MKTLANTLLLTFYSLYIFQLIANQEPAIKNYDYCSLTKKYLLNQNLDLLEDVPKTPLSNFHSEFCPYRTSSCCSRFVEKIIAAKQIIQLELALNEIMTELKKEFDKNVQNLHDAVILSIRASGYNLNNVFNKTYGIVYEKNVDLFYNLFANLEEYVSFNALGTRIHSLEVEKRRQLQNKPQFRFKRDSSIHHSSLPPLNTTKMTKEKSKRFRFLSLYSTLKSYLIPVNTLNKLKIPANSSTKESSYKNYQISLVHKRLNPKRNFNLIHTNDQPGKKVSRRLDLMINRPKREVSTKLVAGDTLNVLISDFFVDIYLRMFTLLNPQYHFDGARLDCVKACYSKVRPFSGSSGSNNDEPARELIVHVSRSLVAAKSLIYALNEVSLTTLDVTTKINQDPIKNPKVIKGRWGQDPPSKNDAFWLSKVIHMDDSSKISLMLLWGCPVCDPLGNAHDINQIPCPEFCKAVIYHNLRHISSITHSWNSFIESALKVVNRLQGPFSVEGNIDTLDVKISEAVMNFQENSLSFSTEIFKTCGQPPLKSYESDGSQPLLNNDKRAPVFKVVTNGTLHGIPSVIQGLKDIENLLRNAKTFWKDIEQSLTFKLCPNFFHSSSNHFNFTNGTSRSHLQPNRCWNGTNARLIDPPTKTLNQQEWKNVSNHAKNITTLLNNEKWPFQDVNAENPIIQNIIYQNNITLEEIALKLNQAYQGSSVSIPDEEDMSASKIPPASIIPHIDDETMHINVDEDGSGSGMVDNKISITHSIPTTLSSLSLSTDNQNVRLNSNVPLTLDEKGQTTPLLKPTISSIIYDLEMEDNRFDNKEAAGSGEDETRGVMLISSVRPQEEYDIIDRVKTKEDPKHLNKMDNSLDGIGKYRKRNYGDEISSSSYGHNPSSQNFIYRIGITFFMLGVVFVP